MSDFVDLSKTLLKAYTESQNDTSDDDVLKELPSIFQDTRAKFFDEDDYECNRAVLVRLKLEGKLEHKFNTSTAFAYITSTRDALEQCKRDLRQDQHEVIVGEHGERLDQQEVIVGKYGAQLADHEVRSSASAIAVPSIGERSRRRRPPRHRPPSTRH